MDAVLATRWSERKCRNVDVEEVESVWWIRVESVLHAFLRLIDLEVLGGLEEKMFIQDT